MSEPIPYVQEEVDRFMALVDKLPCGCWFWTGARSRGKGNRKWYGTFYVNKKIGRVRAHRYACEVIGGKGVLPPGHDRDHQCAFSLCVNPFDCLEYVTKLINQQRKKERRDARKVSPHLDRDRPLGSSDLEAIRNPTVRPQGGARISREAPLSRQTRHEL